MTVRLFAAVIIVGGLVLAGCSAPSLPAPARTPQPALASLNGATGVALASTTPSATAIASPTAAPLTALRPSPTLPTQAPQPLPPATAGTTPAVPPTPGPDTGTGFRAWAVAPDGQFYLLQSSGTVRRYSPDLSHFVDLSGPLFAGRDPGSAHMAINDQLLILSSESLTRTLVLERGSFAPRGELNRAGPVALDETRRLFILAENTVWAYGLSDISAAPLPVTEWPSGPFTPRPQDLAVDEVGGQLLVTLHDISASPPHQQEWLRAYSLDSLQPLSAFPGQPGALTRPSIGGDAIVAGMSALNGFLGSKVAVFDQQGREVRAAQPFTGTPVIDPAGEWIYVLGERGTWILRASDLSVTAMDPYAGNAPVNLLLSPDGSRLYTVGDSYLGVQDTAALRQAGIAPLRGPLPPSWFDAGQTEFFRPRFYTVPSSPETAYVQVGGYGETWRSRDGGATWQLLPGLVYPNFHYATQLSISSDFAHDQALVATTFSPPTFIRSTDGGDTWSAWEPPVAFVSERDGNREIYTADRGEPGGGLALNLVRRTYDPAADENPAWSPGWARIAFQSNRSGNWDIFTIRADCDPGTTDASAACDLQQLSDDPADDMLPAWSPDGRWIAFVSTRGGKADIYLVPAGGGRAQRVTTSPNGAGRPAWLPDSQHLLYTATSANGSNDIAMGRIVEGSDRTLSMAEPQPAVSSPADERDAVAGREFFVYLSNEAGYPRTYLRYNYEGASSFPITVGTEAEGHPAVLGDASNTLLVTLVRNGQTGIYRASSNGYEVFVAGETFNGQPAAGPVPWQPAADSSWERLKAWQR
jgi:hypothetical protein